ncbi:MAG: hypothetical protein NZ959_08540 [Armatimonadetes bacterium]|nr:hypothetical protein [Armatimonadota bacterium]MDW8121702.1 hypothetical protein [Armatimonadota bacterium]
MTLGKWTRRDLLRIGGLSTVLYSGRSVGGGSSEPMTSDLSKGNGKPKPSVVGVFVRLPTPWWMGWPGAAYPVEKREKEMSLALRQGASEIGVDLYLEPKFLTSPQDTEAFCQRLTARSPDAVLVIVHHLYLWNLVETIVNAGFPTIIYAPVGTAFIGPMHSFARRPKVWYVSSTDLSGIWDAFRAVRAARRMRDSRLLILWGDREQTTRLQPLGTEIVVAPVARYVEEFNKVSPDDRSVRSFAFAYRRLAKKTVEPKDDDLINAARTYFAHRRMMELYGADAVATDCLPLVANRQAPPPCLAFLHLRDEGLPAGCEADRDATLTLMLCQYLLDRPGFMGNPVPDTVRHLLITSHCTCPLRLGGFRDRTAPFVLRSHAESDTGVAIQVLWTVGEKVSVTRLLGPSDLMVGTGTVVENLNTPPYGGCRTSVAVRLDGVSDIRSLRGFHHQVLVLGDHLETLRCFAQLSALNLLPLTA